MELKLVQQTQIGLNQSALDEWIEYRRKYSKKPMSQPATSNCAISIPAISISLSYLARTLIVYIAVRLCPFRAAAIQQIFSYACRNVVLWSS